MFHHPSTAFLGDFFRDAFLVHATKENCPCDFSRVFALEEKGFGFGTVESKYFAVSADEETTSTGIDFTGTEGVEFYFHLLD